MPPRAGRETMVEVRQVTKRYQAQGRRQAGGAATQALDGVSFAVAEGEFVGTSIVARQLSRVDLPDPDGPMMPTNSPSATAKLTPSSA